MCAIAGAVCDIVGKKQGDACLCKKRRQRRESSEIGHTALHKKAKGEDMKWCRKKEEHFVIFCRFCGGKTLAGACHGHWSGLWS